ncbi:hypothetical protein IKB17_04725 [bacterium]|nr:hypothetical protein [bacterium]
MVAPIQSLMNMEMALYGGLGTNMNAPSYANGYCASNNFSMGINPSLYNYGLQTSGVYPSFKGNNYSNSFGQNIPYGYETQAQGQSNSIFGGLSSVEKKALVDDYAKNLTPTAGVLKDAPLDAAFCLLFNPRLLVHPINTFKATFSAENATNKFFNSIKNDAKFIELWKTPENSNIMREAWLQHNKAVARCEGKLGAFRRSYKATGEVELITKEVTALEKAIKSGNIDDITRQTARLKHAYTGNPGFVTRGFNWCKNGIGKIIPESWTLMGSPVRDAFLTKPSAVADKLADVAGIETEIANLAKTTKTGFMDILKRGGGVKGAAFFMVMDYLMAIGKIKTAFEEDKQSGWKQLGQTTVRGIGNAAGWMVGEATATWAFTKFGAKLGSKVHPLLGTLIGGAIGMIGGGLGMRLAGKGTQALVGRDVADDIEAKKLAQTQEGQIQLLQHTMERMEKGEKVSPHAQMAIQKIMTQIA